MHAEAEDWGDGANRVEIESAFSAIRARLLPRT